MDCQIASNPSAPSAPSASSASSVQKALDESWVIVSVGGRLFAVPTLSVETMVILPPVVKVPGTPNHARGVINIRGRVLPLLDLRKRMGMESLHEAVEALCETLSQRETDHKNWLVELEASVTENREFHLATDPHKCAFGKWYDHFHTDDLILSALLRQFDEPHRAVHAIAAEAERHKAGGNQQAALHLIEQTRQGTLSRLVDLFESTRAHLRGSTREIAVVIRDAETQFALAADKVESVERLAAAGVSEIPQVMTEQCRALLTGVAKRGRNQSLVLLLSPSMFFSDAAEILNRVA